MIPMSLRKEVMCNLHEGHIGMTKMKALLRTFAYWPNAWKDVEHEVKHCDACIQHQNKLDKMPLKSVVYETDVPWKIISVDLTRPSELLQGKVLLTVLIITVDFLK